MTRDIEASGLIYRYFDLEDPRESPLDPVRLQTASIINPRIDPFIRPRSFSGRSAFTHGEARDESTRQWLAQRGNEIP